MGNFTPGGTLASVSTELDEVSGRRLSRAVRDPAG
jgi:hypothetical protein